MENVHDLEIFPSIFRFPTNTNKNSFHTTTFARNIFIMLIKRVKLLRVFHSFPFYFVYFLGANIIKEGAHKQVDICTHPKQRSNIRKELTRKKVSVTFFQSLEARFSQSYSGHFFHPLSSMYSADDNDVSLWNENRFFPSSFFLFPHSGKDEMVCCHAMSVNLTLINNDS